MDSVMITPWCIYVFEVKDMNGRLQFIDSPVQMLQTKEDGTIIGRKSPIEQIAENEWLLDEWLKVRGIPLPIINCELVGSIHTELGSKFNFGCSSKLQTPIKHKKTGIPNKRCRFFILISYLYRQVGL